MALTEPQLVDQSDATLVTQKALNATRGATLPEDGVITPALINEINTHEDLRNPEIDPDRPVAAGSPFGWGSPNNMMQTPCPVEDDVETVNRALVTLAKECNVNYDHYEIPGRQEGQGTDLELNKNVQNATYEYNRCINNGFKRTFERPRAAESGLASATPVAYEESSVEYIPPTEDLCKGGGYPRQRDVLKVYGPVGKNQASRTPPYPLKFYGKTVTKISLHELVVDSAIRVLERALDHYGLAQIQALKLDQYAGGLCVRKMTSGKSWSMHSWGIAIDWMPAENGFRQKADTATLAKPIYNKWWELWEEECWLSLGRKSNFDWMHVQAARY